MFKIEYSAGLVKLLGRRGDVGARCSSLDSRIKSKAAFCTKNDPKTPARRFLSLIDNSYLLVLWGMLEMIQDLETILEPSVDAQWLSSHHPARAIVAQAWRLYGQVR